MAGAINYLYDPNQAVYVIDKCNTDMYVTAGTVTRIRGEVLVSNTELEYDVRLKGSRGTKAFVESDVWPSKTDAMVDYDNRVK